MSEPNDKVSCRRRCGWHGLNSQLLRAPDPFNPGEELYACPDCRSGDDIHMACDFDGCWEETSSGTPLADGRYVRRCYKHSPRLTGEKARA